MESHHLKANLINPILHLWARAGTTAFNSQSGKLYFLLFTWIQVCLFHLQIPAPGSFTGPSLACLLHDRTTNSQISVSHTDEGRAPSKHYTANPHWKCCLACWSKEQHHCNHCNNFSLQVCDVTFLNCLPFSLSEETCLVRQLPWFTPKASVQAWWCWLYIHDKQKVQHRFPRLPSQLAFWWHNVTGILRSAAFAFPPSHS